MGLRCLDRSLWIWGEFSDFSGYHGGFCICGQESDEYSESRDESRTSGVGFSLDPAKDSSLGSEDFSDLHLLSSYLIELGSDNCGCYFSTFLCSDLCIINDFITRCLLTFMSK